MELNKITRELLAAGYTKEDTPPGMRPYNWFDGGWTYTPDTLYKMVFETPCGLLVEGNHFVGGHMSYMGVDWMVENNNPTVTCPRFSWELCELNHKLLRGRMTYGEIVHCACHLTDRPYTYEQSYDKAHDDVWREAEELFLAFAAGKHGRVCKQHSHYFRMEKKWRIFYNPIACASVGAGCRYCDILQAELSPLKGNVFYDVKITYTEKGFGLFPDKRKTTIIKGKKLLERTVSLTICEAIARFAKFRIQEKELSRAFRTIFFDPSYTVEVQNVRAQRRDTRDLLDDLRAVADGIEIVHAGDQFKAAARQKRERRQNAKERRAAKSERLILKFGFENLDEIEQRRAQKRLTLNRIDELERERAERSAKSNDEPQQMSFF